MKDKYLIGLIVIVVAAQVPPPTEPGAVVMTVLAGLAAILAFLYVREDDK